MPRRTYPSRRRPAPRGGAATLRPLEEGGRKGPMSTIEIEKLPAALGARIHGFVPRGLDEAVADTLRDAFDAQVAVLHRAQARLAELEARLDALEGPAPSGKPA